MDVSEYVKIIDAAPCRCVGCVAWNGDVRAFLDAILSNALRDGVHTIPILLSSGTLPRRHVVHMLEALRDVWRIPPADVVWACFELERAVRLCPAAFGGTIERCTVRHNVFATLCIVVYSYMILRGDEDVVSRLVARARLACVAWARPRSGPGSVHTRMNVGVDDVHVRRCVASTAVDAVQTMADAVRYIDEHESEVRRVESTYAAGSTRTVYWYWYATAYVAARVAIPF